MVAYYYTLDKDPFNAYYSGPTLDQQEEGGYEPKITRAGLYALIEDARTRGNGGEARRQRPLEGRPRSARAATPITGVTVQVDRRRGHAHKADRVEGPHRRDRVRRRHPADRRALPRRQRHERQTRPRTRSVQDHTWVGVFREYPDGIPEHLRIKSPPPGYEQYGQKWSSVRPLGRVRDGSRVGATTASTSPGAAWPTPRARSPACAAEHRHTQCGFNGGNDYPVTVATIENLEQRKRDERDGIYRTLSAHLLLPERAGPELVAGRGRGLQHALQPPADEGARPARRTWRRVAVHLPQQPYVRESRRIIGVKTLVAADLERYEKAKLLPDVGRHGRLLHGPAPHRGTRSRRTSTARLLRERRPVPGAVRGVHPGEDRRLRPGGEEHLAVAPRQRRNADAAAHDADRPGRRHDRGAGGASRTCSRGSSTRSRCRRCSSRTARRWSSAGTATSRGARRLWQATQMLSLYQVMDRPGPINKDKMPLGQQDEVGRRSAADGGGTPSPLTRLAELKEATRRSPALGAKAVTAAR